jgi:hypothetical protein
MPPKHHANQAYETTRDNGQSGKGHKGKKKLTIVTVNLVLDYLRNKDPCETAEHAHAAFDKYKSQYNAIAQAKRELVVLARLSPLNIKLPDEFLTFFNT